MVIIEGGMGCERRNLAGVQLRSVTLCTCHGVSEAEMSSREEGMRRPVQMGKGSRVDRVLPDLSSPSTCSSSYGVRL